MCGAGVSQSVLKEMLGARIIGSSYRGDHIVAHDTRAFSPTTDHPDTGNPPPASGASSPPTRYDTVAQHGEYKRAVVSKLKRNDNAPLPPISFNWRDSSSRPPTHMAQQYLDPTDVDFYLDDVLTIAEMGDKLNRLFGEIRISALHII